MVEGANTVLNTWGSPCPAKKYEGHECSSMSQNNWVLGINSDQEGDGFEMQCTDLECEGHGA